MYVHQRCVQCIVWTWIFQVHKYTVNTLRRCISSDDFKLPGMIRFSTHPAGQQAQLPLYQPPCVIFALIVCHNFTSCRYRRVSLEVIIPKTPKQTNKTPPKRNIPRSNKFFYRIDSTVPAYSFWLLPLDVCRIKWGAVRQYLLYTDTYTDDGRLKFHHLCMCLLVERVTVCILTQISWYGRAAFLMIPTIHWRTRHDVIERSHEKARGERLYTVCVFVQSRRRKDEKTEAFPLYFFGLPNYENATLTLCTTE